MNILSPSLLSVNFNNIEADAGILDEAGVKWYHLDVMDGVFVRNISFGPPVIASIRKITKAFFDVHLMITEHVRYVDVFREAGADMITVHYEACRDLDETIEAIKRTGAGVGLSINPDTDYKVVFPYLDRVDMILVMSVYPGFGGQKFIPDAIDKIKAIRNQADKIGKELHIEVDGGINLDNVSTALAAGADVIVAGSAVFKGDIRENLEAFFQKLNKKTGE